jgi:hypothetical protein
MSKYNELLRERLNYQTHVLYKLLISEHVISAWKSSISEIVLSEEALESLCIDMALTLFCYDESQAKHCRNVITAFTLREEVIAAERKVLDRIKEACREN